MYNNIHHSGDSPIGKLHHHPITSQNHVFVLHPTHPIDSPMELRGPSLRDLDDGEPSVGWACRDPDGGRAGARCAVSLRSSSAFVCSLPPK